MFGRDIYIPFFATVLQPTLRYLGNISSRLSWEMLREAYMMAAINLKKAQDRQPGKVVKGAHKVGDCVIEEQKEPSMGLKNFVYEKSLTHSFIHMHL